MDLKQLRYFIRVSELGSFAKAADLLGVAQPTLSRQVRALEVELKTNLFHRHGRGVLLTPAGARFVEQAHGVVHAADTALQVLQPADRRMSGRVVCGMTPSVGRVLIPEYVRRFRLQLPEASLSIGNHLSTALHDQLRATRLDFAILHNPPPSPNLSITQLGTQQLYLIGLAPLGRDPEKVSMKALHGLPLVMPSGLHAVRKPIELAAARLRIALDIRFEVDVIESVFQLVRQGVGHTISTDIAVHGLGTSSGFSVQRIVSPRLASQLALVTPSERNMTPLQSAASVLAKEVFMALGVIEPRPPSAKNRVGKMERAAA